MIFSIYIKVKISRVYFRFAADVELRLYAVHRYLPVALESYVTLFDSLCYAVFQQGLLAVFAALFGGVEGFLLDCCLSNVLSLDFVLGG